MKRVPCEYILWNLLPAVRNEIARSMVNNFGLNQKEAAAKLEITPAAVCMYLSDKRGNIKIRDKKIINEIQVSAENIIKNENIDLIKETCRLCKIIKSKKLSPFSNYKTIDKTENLLLCKF
jgi:predicted transcriptional regulator